MEFKRDLNTYEGFILSFKRKSGIDLMSYKRNQMERRIRGFMTTHGLGSFTDFFYALDHNPELYHAFLKHLTINVTQFFRDPNQWKMLRDDVIPKFLADRKMLKIWSAGCSGGQEPYSLAITLLEYFPSIRFTILATDIDAKILAQAREGAYKQQNFQTTPPEILKKYFIPTPDGYKINDHVKRQVRLVKHNLLTDPFDSGFHLITCRNVVIYFTESAKEGLYRKFYHSLEPGGIFFIGSTEHLFGISDLGLKSVLSFFYQKIS